MPSENYNVERNSNYSSNKDLKNDKSLLTILKGLLEDANKKGIYFNEEAAEREAEEQRGKMQKFEQKKVENSHLSSD